MARREIPEGMELVRVNVCGECGAEYRTAGMRSLHVHQGSWKVRTELREKAPSRISWQPGYGPDTPRDWRHPAAVVGALITLASQV